MKLKRGDKVTNPMNGQPGIVVRTLLDGTHDLVKVRFTDDTIGYYDLEDDSRVAGEHWLCPMVVQVNTSNWLRLPEVHMYASIRGITIEEAIHLLVNKGLSHE